MEVIHSVKQIVAKNLLELRLAKGITQADLAKDLSYSDKAVSKWERGESLPDLEVLLKISRLYGVSLDYLVTPDHKKEEAVKLAMQRRASRNRTFIIVLSVLLVWFLASLGFVIMTSVWGFRRSFLLCFLYALPISCIVILVLNSVWFEGRKNVYIISVLMWSVLASVYLTVLAITANTMPQIFILGIPGQLIIILWCLMTDPSLISANRYKNKELP